MEPWNIVTKKSWRNTKGQPSKQDRLLIIDPNNYSNDISGGSSSVIQIFDRFAEAFRELNICMSDAEDTHKENGDVLSILERVWGGNYALFEAQRSRLRAVWQQNMASGSNFPRGNNNNNNNQGGNASGRDFPRGNLSNNQGGNGLGSGLQGNPGNPPSGNQENQSNQPKQGKRPADGDDKPSKKQKMSNDNEKKRAPLHSDYEDPKAEKTAELSGPAGAAGKRKKSAATSAPEAKKKKSSNAAAVAVPAPEVKGEKQKIHEEKDRAKTFKRNHPGLNGLPDRMDKALFKQLTEQHGKSTIPKPKSKKNKHQ